MNKPTTAVKSMRLEKPGKWHPYVLLAAISVALMIAGQISLSANTSESSAYSQE